ncbi:MAG TPA: hypothetical protein VEX62_07775 [Candidatus Limnocylindrales bacterium]|nr:hypothetical protein [Candidatus Limnocylindrales bacterium]
MTVADELAAYLFELDPRSLTTGATTTHITRAVLAWAVEKGWLARTEARVVAPNGMDGASAIGFVDVVIRRGHSLADVVIEIDSTDKQWSLAKLRHAAAAGMHAIWIRWGEETWAGAYEDVDVIQLPVARRAAPRAGTLGQLTLWSR